MHAVSKDVGSSSENSSAHPVDPLLDERAQEVVWRARHSGRRCLQQLVEHRRVCEDDPRGSAKVCRYVVQWPIRLISGRLEASRTLGDDLRALLQSRTRISTGALMWMGVTHVTYYGLHDFDEGGGTVERSCPVVHRRDAKDGFHRTQDGLERLEVEVAQEVLERDEKLV